MIVAHLSDLHLGFRAYGRMERGVDVRERDVAVAFERASQQIVRIGPDLVVIAGDVFDRPDPPAGAVVALARGLEVLRATLPKTPVLMVAGPRDTPRRPGDPGALAVFDTFPNVEAATGLTRSILIDRLDLHACLVPYRAVTRHPPALPEPDPRMAWNVLVLHAEPTPPGDVGTHVDPTEWSYVALGGEHRRRKIAATARYCGSLERVALDPWDEAADEKGFLTVDLDSGEVAFHAIPGRPVVALAPVKVAPGDPEGVRKRVLEVTSEIPGGIKDKIVRLRLEGAAPRDVLALQGDPLTGLRRETLHFAVEAGRELRIPPEAWLEGPRLLREAVSAELEREGLLNDERRALVDEVIPEAGAQTPGTFGTMDALDGEVAGLGRISTSIPEGLTAVLGGGGRGRRAVAELFVEAGRAAEGGAIGELWAGSDTEGLDVSIRRAIDAVAESRGLAVADAALERLGAAPSLATPRSAGPGTSEPRRGGAIRVDPAQVGAEFRAAERELTASRADVAIIDGDLEVATMEWLRERQDAETTLHAYRDQARELRTRIQRMEAAGPEAPCPTCGRVLESHYEEVLAELRDQWESVVQDGSWWRSRWEQLELKPVSLRELEGRSLLLHAALEAGSERVELLRARLQELDVPAYRERAVGEEVETAVVTALRRVHAARVARATDLLIQRTSRLVCRISGGRVLAVSWDGDRVHLEGSEGPLTPLSAEDLAAGKVAIRLAGASLIAAGGRVLASLPVEEPFDRLDEEAQIRTVVLIRRLLREVPRVVLFTRGDVVDARPELFDYVLEVRDEIAATGPVLRPQPAGPGRVSFKAPVRPTETAVAGGEGGVPS